MELTIAFLQILPGKNTDENLAIGKNACIKAKEKGADIALFGHTHEPYEEYLPEYGLWLFNPGALSSPARGEPTYGLLTLSGANVLFSHGTITD